MRGLLCDGTSARLRTDLPEPDPAPGETVLKVRCAGICDTDLHLARGYMGYRGVLGHEFVGTDEHGIRYTAEINASCHNCPTCRGGREPHCPHRTVLGILGRSGAMADFVRVPTRNLHAVPDSIADRAAVFIEPLAAAFRIPERVEIGAGRRVGVLGDGKLGLLCAWVLRLEGAEVTLIGKHDEKLALAGPGIAAARSDRAGDMARSFGVVVDATGSPSGLGLALGLVEPEGTVVLKTTIAGEHRLPLAPIVIDEVRVIGSRCGPFPPAIAALASGKIDVTPLIQAEYSLDDAEEAFRAAGEKGARKVILAM